MTETRCAHTVYPPENAVAADRLGGGHESGPGGVGAPFTQGLTTQGVANG